MINLLTLSDVFLNVLKLSALGTIALMLVTLLRWALGKYLAKRYLHFLWLPALLAFIIPIHFLPPNPLALTSQPLVAGSLNLLSEQSSSTQTLFISENPVSFASSPTSLSTNNLQPTKPALTPWQYFTTSLATLWVLGMAILLLRWVIASTLFSRCVRKKIQPLSPATLRLWDEVLNERNLSRHPTLISSDAVDMPVLVGLFKAEIILPATHGKIYSTTILKHILRHELAHYTRGDLYFLAFENLVLMIHWFNPFLWLCHRWMRIDRELGADAAALDKMENADTTSYGTALLDVASGNTNPNLGHAALGIFESKKQLADRLGAIARHQRASWLGLAGIITVSLVLTTFVFGQKVELDLKSYSGLSVDEALIKASKVGDLPAVEHYLKTNPDLNKVIEKTDNKTALSTAATNNQLAVMKLLLRRADPNFHVEGGAWPAIENSIRKGNPEATELLLKHGAVAEANMLAAYNGDLAHFKKMFSSGIKEISFDKITLWTGIAAVNNRLDLYRYLLESAQQHPGLPNWNFPWEGDMETTVARGHKAIIQETLKSYPNGIERFKNGPARITEAAQKIPGMKEWLIERGFTINEYSKGEQIIDASGKNDLPLITKLLDEGADPNYSGESGWSPVVKAANANSLEAVKLLLSRGGSPNSVKSPGWNYSALTLCENPKIADILFAAGADINAKLFKREVHIVTYPVSFGKTEMVKWFISKGVDLKTVPIENEPNLLFSAGSAGVAEILIQQGIDPNAKNKNGATALHKIAAYKTDPEPILRVLLENGANPNVADDYGITPLMAAKDGKSVELLLSYKADPNAKTKEGASVLSYNNHMADVTRIQTLLKHGFKLEPDIALPLLDRACGNGQVDIVKFLLESGVDPNTKIPTKGNTNISINVISSASLRGNLAILKLLFDHGGNPEDGMATALLNMKKDVIHLLWQNGARNIPESTYHLSQGATLEKLKIFFAKESVIKQLNGGHLHLGHPFIYACAINRKDVFDYLYPFYKNNTSILNLAINEACSQGRWEIVKALLEFGSIPAPFSVSLAASNSNPDSNDNQKPEDYVKTVKLLLDSGVLNKATPEERGRALSSAVFTRYSGGNIEIVRLLIKFGLTGNDKSPFHKGKTILEGINFERERNSSSISDPKIMELLEASVK